MRIRRKDSEDADDTDELMAEKITEAVCEQFGDWMCETVPFNLKADIYHRVREAQEAGIEIQCLINNEVESDIGLGQSG